MPSRPHEANKNTTKRTRTVTFALGAMLAVAAPAVYAQVRFGVVDVERAVSETNEGRSWTIAIKNRYDQRREELTKKAASLASLEKRIKASIGKRSPLELQPMVNEYQRLGQDLQAKEQQYTQEIQQIQGKIAQDIFARLQPIVREIALSDGYQIIVDEHSMHFAPQNNNLTDRVVQTYNSRYPVGDGGVVLPTLTMPTMDAGAGGMPSLTGPTGPVGPTGPTQPANGDAGHGLPSVFFGRGGDAG